MTFPHAVQGLTIAVVVFVLAVGAGCSAPCVRDDDCGDGTYCGETDFCVSDCLVGADCADNEFCTVRGECFSGNAPEVEIVSPTELAVDGPFDLVVDLRFVGRQATTTVRRGDDDPGSLCAPFTPQTQVTFGLDGEVTETQLVFRDVVPAGETFSLTVEAVGTTNAVSTTSASYQYSAFNGLDAFSVTSPLPEDVLGGATSVPLEVEFVTPGDYWARVETPFGLPGAFVRVGETALVEPDERLLLARGPQLVVVQDGLAQQARRCEIALDTGVGEGGLEISMAFSGASATGVDLVIVSERDGEVKTCSDNVAGACVSRMGSNGLSLSGDRYRRLISRDGVYGVAVVPRAVAGSVNATLQVAHKTRHVGFFGPGVLQSDVGEVWLAARLFIIDDTLSVELLDTYTIGVPDLSPSAW